MSPTITHDFFYAAYIARLKAGEILPDWEPSSDVDYLVRELNRPKEQGADFSVYQFSDVLWNDFIDGIFGSDYGVEVYDTGYKSEVVIMDSCKEHLRSFISRIHSTDTQLAILEYFTTPDFKTALCNGYIAYQRSAADIQLACAALMGEIKLACLIQDEFRVARKAREQAEEYGITLPDMPGDCPPLFESYTAAKLCKIPSTPAMWLSKDMVLYTPSFEKRIKRLSAIQEREADSLRQHNVPDEEVAQIKFACTLLMRFYNRIRHILINDEDASAYYRSMQPEDRFQAEVNILFHVITAQEMFAFSQAVYAGVQAHRNIPMLQALLEIPSYIDKLESVSLHECMRHLYIVSAFRTMYLKTCPLNEEVERSINEFLGDYFRIYTDLRKEQISEEIFHSKFSYKKPSDTVCINRVYEESKSAIEALSSDSSVPASDLELCHLYLDFLRDCMCDDTPETSVPSEDANFLWPTYTQKATEDDKQTFENYLRTLCKSKKKSLSSDIKNYLKAKVSEGIITRPAQTNTEYDLIKLFGYPYGPTAYYNA